MDNDVAQILDDKLTKFNKLKYEDKVFVRSMMQPNADKVEIAMKAYGINDHAEADIHAMTTLSRKEIQDALDELNSVQSILVKSRLLNSGEKALNKINHIMEYGAEEETRLKAATTILKQSVDLIKEDSKKHENKEMKIIIENPGGVVNINYNNQDIMSSFNHQEESDEVDENVIIEGEVTEIEKEEEDEK